jgi:hypothetical protein
VASGGQAAVQLTASAMVLLPAQLMLGMTLAQCAQIFFADKFGHATSVPVALCATRAKVRVLGRRRAKGFGVVAWGIGTKAS